MRGSQALVHLLNSIFLVLFPVFLDIIKIQDRAKPHLRGPPRNDTIGTKYAINSCFIGAT